MVNTGSTKCRRIAPGGQCIADLPGTIFVIVAALRFWEQQPSAASKMTVSLYQWEILDCEEISKALASNLSDNDIGVILVCVNGFIRHSKG